MFPPAELDGRFSAFVVDRLIGWGISAAVGYAVWRFADPGVGVAILSAVGCAVLLGLLSAVLVGTTGLTPGKAVVGLRVVRRPDGRPIGVLPAIGRTAVLGVAGVPTIGMGLATLGWTAAADPSRQRLGLHDRIGEAIVIDVRPVPEDEPDDESRPQQIVNLTAMRLVPVAAPDRDRPPALIPTPVPNRAPHQGLPAPPSAPPSPPVAQGQDERTRLRSAGQPAPAPAPTAQPVPTVRWQVAFDTGEAFVVEGLAVVGRRPELRADEVVRHVVPLRSSDMSLSKTHAQFQVAPDGALVVMDRGSTNGSYVIRRGLSKALTAGRPSTLLAGDEVRFGDRTMRVEQV